MRVSSGCCESGGGGGGGGGGGMGGDDGHHQRQFQYQSLLAAVHTMPGQGQHNPNQTLPFPLPFPAGPGADASTHSAAPQSPTPRGFADWSASSSAFTSLAAQATPATSNAFHYSLSPCSAFWTHYLLNNNAYCSYPPAPHQEHAHPLCHNDNRAKDPGPASSFGVESFTTTSLAPNIFAYMPPIEGPISAKETEISEDLPRAVKRSDVRATRNNGELKCETVDTFPESKQGHESCATTSKPWRWHGQPIKKLNSGEYQVILRKELTKSDVGNVGRIVLPKKDAEASFPPLVQRDPLILQMDDMVLPVTWKFKYRYWPNNKSRMYILDSTGEFVKTHGLQAGDALVIYKNSAPGKFIIRGEKAIQLTTNP